MAKIDDTSRKQHSGLVRDTKAELRTIEKHLQAAIKHHGKMPEGSLRSVWEAPRLTLEHRREMIKARLDRLNDKANA